MVRLSKGRESIGKLGKAHDGWGRYVEGKVRLGWVSFGQGVWLGLD